MKLISKYQNQFSSKFCWILLVWFFNDFKRILFNFSELFLGNSSEVRRNKMENKFLKISKNSGKIKFSSAIH